MPGSSNAISCTRRAISSLSPGDPGTPRLRRSTSALPSQDTPSLSLTIASVISGRAARRRISAAITSSIECRFSNPSGWLIPRSAKSFRHPDLVPKGKQRGSAAYMGMPNATARSRSSGVVLYGTKVRTQGVRHK